MNNIPTSCEQYVVERLVKLESDNEEITTQNKKLTEIVKTTMDAIEILRSKATLSEPGYIHISLIYDEEEVNKVNRVLALKKQEGDKNE